MRVRTAVMLGLVASTVLALGDDGVLPAAIVFVVASVAAVHVDLRERRLPHRIVLPAIAVVLAADAAVVLVAGGVDRLGSAALGGLVAFGAMFVLHLISPTGLGFGDVTYAALIGSTLGWFGLPRVGLALALGLGAGALLAGPLVWVLREHAVRREIAGKPPHLLTVPLGPALAAGGWVALCWGGTIGSWITG